MSCPSCTGSDVQQFYHIENVPVHSCVVLKDRGEAQSFPTDSITLGYCKRCGFITNLDYDASLIDYSRDYEDQQCFSPTFNAFANNLAQNLIRKHDIRDKVILEIGCGKADFLALMCKLGDNIGIGIDPALSPSRVEEESTDRLTLIKEYFSEKFLDIKADVVICRHTLEHIKEVGRFMGMIRDLMGDRSEPLLFIEVPDTLRILKEIAFWDIYYEHCSYFCPRSLNHLLKSSGFVATETSLAYGNQYILVEARPLKKRKNFTESSTPTSNDVVNFKRRCPGKIEFWRDRASNYIQRESGLFWGSGSKCVSFLTSTNLNEDVDKIIDINPYRQGKFIPSVGAQIVSPTRLVDLKPGKIMVMNPIYTREIEDMVKKIGVEAGFIPIR